MPYCACALLISEYIAKAGMGRKLRALNLNTPKFCANSFPRMPFAQDFLVANTAAATLRQLVNEAFDRVVKEDKRNKSKAEDPGTVPQKNANVPELPPCAMDAYHLFQVCAPWPHQCTPSLVASISRVC